MKAKLITTAAEFVKELDIPPFHKEPDVIHYGARTFQYQKTENDTLIYTECMAWRVPV